MSRIAAISDIHGEMGFVHKLKDHLEARNISDLLILGDFSRAIGSIDENREDIRTIVNALGDLANIYAIPGNCDSDEIIKVLRSFGIAFHNQAVDIGPFRTVLYGGANPTPFDTPWERDEETIAADLAALFKDGTGRPTVLAVHAPPKDTKCDMIPNGMHVGSGAIRHAIEEYKPVFVVCGHIHECAGKTDTLGTAAVINIGPFGEGNMVEIASEGMTPIRL